MPSLRTSLLSLAFLAACGDATSADPRDLDSDSPESLPEAIAAGFSITEVADFNSPWAMTFLPDGRMLVTEKAGTLHLVSADGTQRKTVTGTLPVSSAGQGGLLDVVIHPQFAQNRLVYFSYSESRSTGKGVALARGTFTDGTSPSLANVQVIFRATPYVSGDGHFSGRIAFSSDGKLFFTNGDRQKFDPAQDPTATLGKVLRLNDDGTPAAGNPLAARGFHPAVWSYGHRNLLGLAFDASGNLWEQEMGPQGGDEVNLIQPGLNYGWPNASNGSHYDGRDIPDHRAGDGYEAPKVWWNPVISPGGLMVYSGKLWPEWKGDLFIGGLSSQSLVRVDLNGTAAAKGNQWSMNSRIREVEEGPDGSIWLLQDGQSGSQGKLLRLRPAP
ncbi:PQQ-dependent oxidoreductase, gdhB family [Cystobacter fuscus DSM 2262]|uniref:PQQ-dependent oxidoreductase, gdhB family n=1 Tax=Cystobacter fuscus (strain ATCC 25194 / DSM 2262 / NBRC 100088 / M29) TaxID=1242864 RepID=S9P7M3_CYSF2|nr:PQQ-dependent sugar dehydrogenase [Cystobacter fuscus]EPX58217.1 PQQ-dependent oxidoreductase, gdhB family [Cystobacter fuscus DSM 2262]